MEVIESLRADLEAGFTKSDLERLIGLPLNSLTEVLKGKRKLSKKSIIKVKRWMESDKPDPLTLSVVKKQVAENNKPENKKRILAERESVSEIPKRVLIQPVPKSQCTNKPPEGLTPMGLRIWIEEQRILNPKK